MSYFYYEILSNGNLCNNTSKKPLPTYPHTLRFKTFQDMETYWRAKRQFIQSTKIPESCNKCPLGGLGACQSFYSGTPCRVTWRKIWEYVK